MVEEFAVVRNLVPGIVFVRLSGSKIRNYFFFGTSPGNQHLAVSI